MKSLTYYLIQEANRNRREVAQEYSHMGEPLPPGGRYTNSLTQVLKEIQDHQSKYRLASDSRNQFQSNLGINLPSESDWTDIAKQLVTSNISEVFGRGRVLKKDEAIEIELKSSWTSLDKTESSCRNYLCFYLSQILRGIGFEAAGKIGVKGFIFLLKSNKQGVIVVKV